MSEEEAKVWKNLDHTNSLCYTIESDPFDISDGTVFLPNTFNKILEKFRELRCSHVMIVGYVPSENFDWIKDGEKYICEFEKRAKEDLKDYDSKLARARDQQKEPMKNYYCACISTLLKLLGRTRENRALVPNWVFIKQQDKVKVKSSC